MAHIAATTNSKHRHDMETNHTTQTHEHEHEHEHERMDPWPLYLCPFLLRLVHQFSMLPFPSRLSLRRWVTMSALPRVRSRSRSRSPLTEMRSQLPFPHRTAAVNLGAFLRTGLQYMRSPPCGAQRSHLPSDGQGGQGLVWRGVVAL